MKKILLLFFVMPFMCIGQTFDFDPLTISIPDSVWKEGIPEDSIETVDIVDPVMQAIADGEYAMDNYKDVDPITGYKQALEYFKKALDLGARDAYLFFKMGLCETKIGDYASAIADLTTSIRFQGENPYFSRDSAYNKSANGYILYQFSVPLQDRPFQSYVYRADCKRLLEDYRGAIGDYSKTLEFTQDYNSYIYFQRACCKFNLNDFIGAKADYTASIKSGNQYKGLSYLNRGGCNYNLDLVDAACNDWSKAGELGVENAYKSIQKHCK